MTDIELIESYFTKIGIDPKQAREKENIYAVIQGNAKVFVIVAGGFLIVQSRVTTVSKKNQSEFYKKLLTLNDTPDLTLGAAFGINQDDEVIVKMLKPIRNTAFDDFVYILTSVAYVADKYTKYFIDQVIK